jgi:hypothetical protein
VHKHRFFATQVVRALRELFDQTLESLRVIHCKVSHGFAVEGDVGLFHCACEFGVGSAVCTSCRVDAECPEVAELAFLGAAVLESVLAGFADGFVCYTLFGRAVKAIAFGLRQDVSAALGLHCSSFYTCHKNLLEFLP